MCHCPPLIPSSSSCGFPSMGLGQHLVSLLPSASTRYLAWVSSAPMLSVSVTPRPLWTHHTVPMTVGRTDLCLSSCLSEALAGQGEAVPSSGSGMTNSLPSFFLQGDSTCLVPTFSLLPSERSNSQTENGDAQCVCVCICSFIP